MCPLSLPPDFAFCLRVRTRDDVKLKSKVTNTFTSNAFIVVVFATMIGTSVSDASLVNKLFDAPCEHVLASLVPSMRERR